VSHSLADVVKGGAFAVLAVDNATDTDHPPGTMVPPKGSQSVSGPAVMQNNTAMMAAGNQSQPSVNMTVTNSTMKNNTAMMAAGNQSQPSVNMTVNK
jgi:hypothetical protein